jgi:soluble lytic murein transglycosylase
MPSVVRVPRAGDTALAAAESALAQGRPWRATELVTPLLRDPARRTPAAVLLAARAAAAWSGWVEVVTLLSAEPWVDTLFAGHGDALLARAFVERELARDAVAPATHAVERAPNGHERGMRLVLLARAYDQLNVRDSARDAYTRAADELPAAAEWLRLRAAAITDDSASRAAVYATLRLPTTKRRADLIEAQALERSGDSLAGARAYAAAGAPTSALRLRLALASATIASGAASPAMRDSLRGQLVGLLASVRGAADVRVVVDLLDASFDALEPAEELAVARALGAGGGTRAAVAYEHAFARGVGTPDDRFAYATLLVRLGRPKDAVVQFARVKEPRPLAASAAYQRARTMVNQGNITAARTALRDVVRDYPEDGSAASALYLLADLATDEQRDEDARDALLALGRRFPTNARASTARFRAAMIAFTAGSFAVAAAEFDTLRQRYGSSAEALAAGYWGGRAWAAAHDSAAARVRWRAVSERDPVSYYADLSARKLGEEPWAPPAAADSFAAFPALDSALARIDLLETLGMADEAGLEYDRVVADADSSVEKLLATADAMRARRLTIRAITLAQRAQSRGAPRDARLYRLLYPMVLRDGITAEAKQSGLDPWLVAGLIRQESRFDAKATSAAGARGLMQIMPAVGQQLSGSLGMPVWDPVLLYQPDVNAILGTRHLADLTKQYNEVAHVLAAYNAGVSRVDRWKTKSGTQDVEVFIEQIPFVETRDYVRLVLRNRDMYRALYP